MTRNAVKATDEAAKQNTDIQGTEKGLARRDLFRVAGLGVGALGAVAAGVTATSGTAEAAPAEMTSTGYRETDHVRKVYEVSRF
ncbi:formate dehydrogenase [Azospirillum sp. A1-3]|uniref:formate dehydrogenase n=1 Tax=Azospirillum sp. A1-3 TaxID=185874 RepID=UPI0020777693|nr:formate dehydrogenase [Azospirillum sp. A1-3]MCM8733079.1 formate dehydrogenase [Azospirillum sp. A1-3]